MTRRWSEEESPPPVDLRLALPAIAVWVGCLIGLSDVRIAWWTAVLALMRDPAASCVVHRCAGAADRGPCAVSIRPRAPSPRAASPAVHIPRAWPGSAAAPGPTRSNQQAGTGPPPARTAARWAVRSGGRGCLPDGRNWSSRHSTRRNAPTIRCCPRPKTVRGAALDVTVDGFPTQVSSGFSRRHGPTTVRGRARSGGRSATRWRVPVTVQHAQVAGEQWTSTIVRHQSSARATSGAQ